MKNDFMGSFDKTPKLMWVMLLMLLFMPFLHSLNYIEKIEGGIFNYTDYPSIRILLRGEGEVNVRGHYNDSLACANSTTLVKDEDNELYCIIYKQDFSISESILFDVYDKNGILPIEFEVVNHPLACVMDNGKINVFSLNKKAILIDLVNYEKKIYEQDWDKANLKGKGVFGTLEIRFSDGNISLARTGNGENLYSEEMKDEVNDYSIFSSGDSADFCIALPKNDKAILYEFENMTGNMTMKKSEYKFSRAYSCAVTNETVLISNEKTLQVNYFNGSRREISFEGISGMCGEGSSFAFMDINLGRLYSFSEAFARIGINRVPKAEVRIEGMSENETFKCNYTIMDENASSASSRFIWKKAGEVKCYSSVFCANVSTGDVLECIVEVTDIYGLSANYSSSVAAKSPCVCGKFVKGECIKFECCSDSQCGKEFECKLNKCEKKDDSIIQRERLIERSEILRNKSRFLDEEDKGIIDLKMAIFTQFFIENDTEGSRLALESAEDLIPAYESKKKFESNKGKVFIALIATLLCTTIVVLVLVPYWRKRYAWSVLDF